MDDLKRITISEVRNVVSFTGDNLPIAFNDDARGPNFELLEERGDRKSVGDFPFLAIDFQFHTIKKPHPRQPRRVAREYGFKFVPL